MENNSRKKWYKIHIPKSERKGLSNRQKSGRRIDMFYGKK